jgi:hypothetical protein
VIVPELAYANSFLVRKARITSDQNSRGISTRISDCIKMGLIENCLIIQATDMQDIEFSTDGVADGSQNSNKCVNSNPYLSVHSSYYYSFESVFRPSNNRLKR